MRSSFVLLHHEGRIAYQCKKTQLFASSVVLKHLLHPKFPPPLEQHDLLGFQFLDDGDHDKQSHKYDEYHDIHSCFYPITSEILDIYQANTS